MFKLHNHNIILPKYLEIVKKKGSSLSLPAHGLGGARATSLLVAHFALRNTASNSAEKKGSPRLRLSATDGQASEGVAEGRGLGGGIPPRPSRSEAFPLFGIKPNIKAKQFSNPFKRKRVVRKIQKIERKLFCFARRSSAGGNAERNHSSDFRSKKVRASFSNCDHKGEG